MHNAGVNILSRLILLLVVLGVGSQVLAQQPGQIVMSPIPFWNDAAPPEKPGAFFDARQNQLVLLIAKPGDSNLHQVRYDVPNGVKASVDFSVQPASAGTIRYVYSLNDDPQARQRSKRLRMLLPAHDSSLLAADSAWQFETEATTFPDRTATVKAARMRFASWQDRVSGDGKVSGLRIVLESTYRPGFVDAFIDGQVKTPLTPEALAGMPAEISQQAQQFLEPGIGNIRQTLLGPLFRPDTQKIIIAANYHFGVSVLQRASRIRADSPYAQQLLATLSAFLQAGGTGVLSMPSALPTSPVEQVIQQALVLCFK